MARLGSSANYDDGKILRETTISHIKLGLSVCSIQRTFGDHKGPRCMSVLYTQWNVLNKGVEDPQYVAPDKVLEDFYGPAASFCDRFLIYSEYIPRAGYWR